MKPLSIKGDCDCCVESINVILYELRGMKMCQSCYTQNEDALTKSVEANSFIQSSRDVDTSIEIKLDVFTATTTAAVEVMGAILADASIPESQKNYVMAQESLKRFQHLQQVIFDEKKQHAERMQEKENQMRAWQVQVHTFAAKVEGAQREKFKNFDVSYQPKPTKITKATTTSRAPNTFKKPTKLELFDASKKYNVPMAAVAMVATGRNMTAEEAARSVAANMKLIPSAQSN